MACLRSYTFGGEEMTRKRPSKKVKPVEMPEEITVEKASVHLCSQADLSHAAYALYLLGKDEKDPEKKAAFKNVGDAFHEITNFFGMDAIGSFEVLREYYPDKFTPLPPRKPVTRGRG
jgi:hypothetical protein